MYLDELGFRIDVSISLCVGALHGYQEREADFPGCLA